MLRRFRRFRKSISWPKYNLDESFGFALRGLVGIFKTQRNARIILLSAALSFVAGLYFNIDIHETLILILTIGLVFVAEVFNTMTEEILDIISPEFNPKAKLIKDTSAAAVLVAALTALVVGYFIFAKKIFAVLCTSLKLLDF